MSTLADLLVARTGLGEADRTHLQHLVASWQLVADLSFADLVLWVRTSPDGWLAAAHMRPTTGPTAYPDDVIGTVLTDPRLVERALREGRPVLGAEPGPRQGPHVRAEAVPVRRAGRVLAVLGRDTNLATARVPSQLELTYLSSSGELLQMVAEGTFPFRGQDPEPENHPRVGDGLLRLDRTGHVVYASPNALSASRRLGIAGDLLGAHLGHTIAGLSSTGTHDEPRGSAAVAAALRFREPRDSEVESSGAVVQLRVLPLLPGGEPRGALVLLRDVTEVRRRDRQIMGKDATIREIHHRVKNNLQTVAALLRLQARRMSDAPARAALEESVRRVASIALVHEMLSTALDEQVAFDGIADRVLAMCAEVVAPQSQVRVLRLGSFGVLGAQVATALSMVLTELVQNALEHAFAGGTGRIAVEVERAAGMLAVDVVDDGRGLPATFDLASSKRLGLQIVRTLVDSDLRGTLELLPEPVGGTRARLRVPLPDPLGEEVAAP